MFRVLASRLLLILLIGFVPVCTIAESTVNFAEIQILSTNLASAGTRGEWGLSALVRADHECILWDTGRYPDTVISNAASLGVDLTCIKTIVLSHFHFDHTGGLVEIVNLLRRKGITRSINVYVAKGFFEPRYLDQRSEAGRSLAEQLGSSQWNMMLTKRSQIESLGVKFIEVSKATEVARGVWATGPIERKFDEENFPKFSSIDGEDGAREVDWVPDSQGLVIKTSEGPIVLSGCGHSGTVNLVAQVTNTIQKGPVLALMGGLHLFNASDSTLSWTGLKLKETGISYLMAGHCTGVIPMFSLKEALGLSRSSAVIGAVGAKFTTGKGIEPTPIAK